MFEKSLPSEDQEDGTLVYTEESLYGNDDENKEVQSSYLIVTFNYLFKWTRFTAEVRGYFTCGDMLHDMYVYKGERLSKETWKHLVK